MQATDSGRNRYYSMAVDGGIAEIDIYGDITSWPWIESDVSAHNLSQRLAELGDDVAQINVNINSYGGEVAEGLAIYNALLRHKAKVTTRCDGFACSIASVIFMAGEERVMNEASLLMIHNAWTYASGNANDLRKQAEDLDTITGASKRAYLSRVGISEEELTALMDAETFITPEDAIEMGFATSVEGALAANVSQSARGAVFRRVMATASAVTGEDEDPDEPEEPDGSEGNGADDEAEPEGDPEPQPEDDPEGEDEEPEEKPSAASTLAAFMTSIAGKAKE